MSALYMGKLERDDPLYGVLADTAYPDTRNPIFRVDRLSGHRLVYRYSEEKTQRAVVGKFFKLDEPDQAKVARIKSEYTNLMQLRHLGFSARPYSVVTPLCRDDRIGLAVAEEYVKGKDLDHYLCHVAGGAEHGQLRRVLSHLAAFLSVLHDKTTTGRLVQLDRIEAYFQRILSTLARRGLMSPHETSRYHTVGAKWLERAHMHTAEVTVHGDATPTNFLFAGDDVVAIDLERMKFADRAYDVGMVCGELKHAFFWRTGNHFAAEPFIHHFLREYARHSPAPRQAFRDITRRVPYYMGLTELRIARNGWLDWEYRKRLIVEAYECLTWGLRV